MATEMENPTPHHEDNPRKTLDPRDPSSTKPSLTTPTTLLSSLKPASLEIESDGTHKEVKGSKDSDSVCAEDLEVSSPLIGNSDGPISDTQKKTQRAERFGMPVQLSEEEKRSSRAERFGTGSALLGDALKKSEEQKRKSRAERFGLHVEPMPVDEDAKKKARLARFSHVSKTDSVEEDKKKARAIRFSAPTSSSLPQVNVKGDVEPAGVLGKASGGV